MGNAHLTPLGFDLLQPSQAEPTEVSVELDVAEDRLDFGITQYPEGFAVFRKEIVLGLFPKAAQAEADVYPPVALGMGAFRFEGAGVAGSCLVNTDFGPVAVLSSLTASCLVGQALVSRTDKLVLVGIIGEVLRAKECFADQFGFAMFLLFPIKSVVFDVIA